MVLIPGTGGVGEEELHAQLVEEIRQPISEAGGFYNGLMRAGELREVGSQALPVVSGRVAV